MAEERVQRKLAAILAADVVGYSRLIGANGEGTIAQQKVHRSELIDGVAAPMAALQQIGAPIERSN